MRSGKLRALALMLSAIMVLTAVPSTLFAEDFFGDGAEWDAEVVADDALVATDGFDFGFEAEYVEPAVVEDAAFDGGFVAEAFEEDALVADSSTPYDLSHVANIGNVVFYYNDATYPDGTVTFTRQETGATGTTTTNGIIKHEKITPVAATPWIASDIQAAEGDDLDLTSGNLGQDVLGKLVETPGESKYVSVAKDCTLFVIAANIDGIVYISKPFTKYDYIAKKSAEHKWVRVIPDPTDKAEYQVRKAASCTEDGEGFSEWKCVNPECATCEAKKTETYVLKATGHMYKFSFYELGDNSTWADGDSTNGKTEAKPPVAKGYEKETYSYVKVSVCDFCGDILRETITESVKTGILTYDNAKNIYEPETQLKGDYLNPEKMKKDSADYTRLAYALRLTDCTKDGSYDIVYIGKDGAKQVIASVTIDKHHSPDTIYVTKSGNTYVALDSKLFEKKDGKVYSKVCVKLEYYDQCEWCQKLKSEDKHETETDDYWKDKYSTNHNFGISAEELKSKTTFVDLEKAVKEVNKVVTDTNPDGYVVSMDPNEIPETVTNCEDGLDVKFAYKCPLCGKEFDEKSSDPDKKVLSALGYPLEAHVTFGHDVEYTEVERKDPTCLTEGLVKYEGKCKRCENYKDTRFVPLAALGHDIDETKLYVRIDGDTVLDSVRDRLYKKLQTYGASIGFIEDKSIAILAGHKCKRCGYIDPIKGTSTMTIADLNAKTIDVLNPAGIDGTITINVDVKDETGKVLDFTLVDATGAELGDSFPEKSEDAIYLKKGTTTKQFVGKFGLISIDYQPTTESTTEPTTETSSEVQTQTETVTESETQTASETQTETQTTTETETQSETVTVTETQTETTTEVTTMPGQVTGEKVSKNSPAKGIIGVKYNAVEGADSYTVNVREPNGKWTKYPTNGAETAYEITGLTEGKCYDIRIAAIAKGVAGPRSGHLYRWLKKVTLMKPTKIKAEAGAVNVTWDAADGATKYKLYVATDKAFKNLVANEKVVENTAKVTGLKAGTKYYFKVRCYTKGEDGKTYTGGWSNVRSKTLK